MNVTSAINFTVASVTAGTIASSNYIDGRLTKAMSEVIYTIFPPTLLTTDKQIFFSFQHPANNLIIFYLIPFILHHTEMEWTFKRKRIDRLTQNYNDERST